MPFRFRASVGSSVIVALIVALLSQSAAADIYLSGVVGFRADITGNSVSEPGEFDNIIATGNNELVVNGQPRGTTFALANGANNFIFTGPGANNTGLSLYFAPTGAAFSRPFDTTPDLAAYTIGAGPLTPLPGTLVQTNGQFSGTNPYHGSPFYSDGVSTVAFTGFTTDAAGGTFQLTVAPVPEPTAATALALGAVAFLRRTRRGARATLGHV